jgi:phage replication O-like protein O
MATDNPDKFPGFQFPTTTPVPDEVFDVLMPQLTGAELKVLLYICRRTYGFKKESDNISLQQISSGITTKDGRALDGGTGLSIPSVTTAVRTLEEKGIILRQKRQSVEKGCEATTYSLKFVPPLKNLRGGSSKIEEGGLQKFKTQQTVLQETEKQHHVVVRQNLENFGIAKSAATRLMQDYPEDYIREKLDIAQGLVAAGSSLVSQNPAGWLRKAIEEDYALPRNHQGSKRHKAKEEKNKKIVQADPEEQPIVDTDEEPQKVKTTTTEQLLEEYTPQPIGEEGLTTESAWNLILQQLKGQVSVDTYETRLKGTILLQLTDSAARIAVPSSAALAWLERRLYGQICSAMKGVLGKDLDLQFVAAT